MQTDIFTTVKDSNIDVDEALEAYKNIPRKRIHNKTPTYTKVYENYQDSEGNVFDDVNTWGRMDTVYEQLTNHFPLCMTQEKSIDFGMVRSSRKDYHIENYEYKDLLNPRSEWREYTGQEFTVRQAEIIGSELLPIEERLFLHESLLEYLNEGYRIDQLNWWIESLLNLCLQGYSARVIVLALILMPKETEKLI